MSSIQSGIRSSVDYDIGYRDGYSQGHSDMLQRVGEILAVASNPRIMVVTQEQFDELKKKAEKQE
jgi:hypothetical protein